MPDWLRDSFTLGGPFVSGLVIYLLSRFHERNTGTLKIINGKLDHLDDCLDGVKQRVAFLEGKAEKAAI